MMDFSAEIKTHQCCCVLIDRAGIRHPCPEVVKGNDNPFCSTCEGRHADESPQPGDTVTAEFPRGVR